MGRRRKSNKSKQESSEKSPEPEAEESNSSTKLYTLEKSDIFGRYLKTNTDVVKGTLLLAEKFLIAGPMRSSDIVCVGCHADLPKRLNSIRCPRCSWLICSKKCADSIYHVDECKFFVETKIKPPAGSCTTEFGALTVLRGLIMKIQNPEGFKKLLTLEPHNEVRKLLPLWRENELSVVQVILRDLGLEKFFTTEEVHSVCGILEVNAFELGDKYSFRGVFAEAAMMAHDCVPNTTHFENPVDGIIEVRAAVDIPAGSPVTVCYAYALEVQCNQENTSQRVRLFITNSQQLVLTL